MSNVKDRSGQKRTGRRAESKPSRPHIPGYGISESEEGMLSWSHVGERMESARNYWVGTTRPDGRPHAVPVWGVWVDGTFYFGGGLHTRKARNLEVNPALVEHLEDGDAVVIIEGTAVKFTQENIDPSLLERIDGAYEAKYGMRHGTPLWGLQPRVAFAWTDFLKDATRWLFDED